MSTNAQVSTRYNVVQLGIAVFLFPSLGWVNNVGSIHLFLCLVDLVCKLIEIVRENIGKINYCKK